MTFTVDSYLVRFYVKKVNEGLPRESVPRLYNLQEVVYQVLGV